MIAALFSRHPDEKVLSHCCDLSEAEQARTRAGRHIRQCGQCAATIAEYRAIGAAARAMRDAVPSPLLASRVRAAAGSHQRAPVAAAVSSRRRSARTIVPAAMAATALLAVLLWPSEERPRLSAASFERLVIAPLYPIPGSEVSVRWEAPSGMPSRDTVWLHGTLAQHEPASGLALDVRVPLSRSASGDYRGVLDIPRSVRSGALRVAASHRVWLFPGRATTHLLLTGVPGAEGPSLDALETATEVTWGGNATGRALAGAFERWAPEHPLRHLLVQERSGPLDWLDVFSSRERTYARLDEALGSRRAVRVYEMVGMIRLAYAIEEPGEAARWTARLVREHPAHPRALAAQAAAIHHLELEGIGRDSIAKLLPQLDTLYDSARGRLLDRWMLVQLVNRNADSATAYRWRLRWVRAGYYPTGAGGEGALLDWMRDPAVSDSAEAEARERLTGTRVVSSVADPFARPRSYAVLAAVALARGTPGRAVELTDSARLERGPCIEVGGLIRARALLAAGQHADATEAFAEYAFPRGITLDSARTLIGPGLDLARWTIGTERGRVRRAECQRTLLLHRGAQ